MIILIEMKRKIRANFFSFTHIDIKCSKETIIYTFKTSRQNAQLILLLTQVGTKKKVCSGLSYTMEYVSEKKEFDELVIQDGSQSFDR
jgi:Fe-S cluster assembly iron-binding protein IscA